MSRRDEGPAKLGARGRRLLRGAPVKVSLKLTFVPAGGTAPSIVKLKTV